MKNSTPKQEKTEAELVTELRGDRSLKTFATYLNEKIPALTPGKITSQSVWHWVNEIYFVNQASLWAWQRYYPEGDPRHQLAVDILELRRKNDAELSDVDKKKVLQAVISRTKVGKAKERITA